jgi:hypothetical protein
MNPQIAHESPRDFPPVSVLGARDRIAACFAVAILALCSLMTLGLAVYWYQHVPVPPPLNGTLESNKALLEQFRAQGDIALEHVTKIFDLLVAKAFLPIFATIIGFLLGKRDSA